MANLKISELTAAGALTGVELIELVQGGANKKSTTQDIANLGGGGTWGSITGTLSNQTDLNNALTARQLLVNSATVITDASTMDITAIKNTLTTSSSTRTFTISYTGDYIYMEITLNTTTCTLTFPATALCRSEGIASGDNTCVLSGASGDVYVISIAKAGSNYKVAAANFAQ